MSFSNFLIYQDYYPVRVYAMNDKYTYRLENESDYFETENLTREAFWDVYKPGCSEHLVVRNMRKAACYIGELSYVCETQSKKIVGAIYCSETIILDEDKRHTVMCVGPIGVLPEYQKKGIGLRLLELSLVRAKELGYACAVLFGNPDYYRKAGFTDAARFGIHLADGSDMDAFMCRPLDVQKLGLIKGRNREDPVFFPDDAELAEYEKQFPLKEKHKLPGQIFD